MKSVFELVQDVKFKTTKVIHQPKEFTLVGRGRSAAVFRIGSENRAVKVFYPAFHHLAAKEAEVYRRLNNTFYFPAFLEEGANYIIVEYLSGVTFYDCLVKGLEITPRMVDGVDQALDFAKSKGLNPSDIHLGNIIFTNKKEIKIIDVVRFTQDKKCNHWSDLKKAYDIYYQRKYFPKRYPKFFIEFIIRLYRLNLLPI